MRTIGFLLCLSALGSTLRAQAAPQPTPPPAAKPADVSSADAIIAALYDVISGPAGQKRDWDRFRSLFAPGARLIPSGTRQNGAHFMRVLTPDEYATNSAPVLEQNGFFEREISQTSESFGGIMHRFSTYESRHTATDTVPFTRGINSIQLVNDGQRWWVVTIFWEGERPGLTIPDRYLKKP